MEHLTLKSRRDVEREIAERVNAERRRLEAEASARRSASQFHRPVERPFTPAERSRVTIIFGGLTWKHERLLRSAFESVGYKVESNVS